MELRTVSLQEFRTSHRVSLARWLSSPPVAKWYPDPEDILGWASQPPAGGAHAVIAVPSLELGYVRWQRVPRDTLDSLGLSEIPHNAVDIDILIGEERYLGKGIGTEALLRLVDRLRREGDVPMLGLSPEPTNFVAIRSYEKAGFRFHSEYSAGDDRRVYRLMTLDCSGAPSEKRQGDSQKD